MKHIYYLFTSGVILILFNSIAFSQPVTAGDCNQAVNICTNASFSVDPNGYGSINEFGIGTTSNPSTNPSSSNSGCLLSGELNSTWMIINIATSGTLEFSFWSRWGFLLL